MPSLGLLDNNFGIQKGTLPTTMVGCKICKVKYKGEKTFFIFGCTTCGSKPYIKGFGEYTTYKQIYQYIPSEQKYIRFDTYVSY